MGDGTTMCEVHYTPDFEGKPSKFTGKLMLMIRCGRAGRLTTNVPLEHGCAFLTNNPGVKLICDASKLRNKDDLVIPADMVKGFLEKNGAS